MKFHILSAVIGLTTSLLACGAIAHELTRDQALAAIANKNAAHHETSSTTGETTGKLTINIRDAASGRPLAATIRITALSDGSRWQAADVKSEPGFWRSGDWYSMASGTTFEVPRDRLRVEAFRGLGWGSASAEIDLRQQDTGELAIELKQFDDPGSSGWYSGNTHLHLMNLSRNYADHYLQVVPDADEISMLYVSHLEYLDQTPTYITNEYDKASLAALSTEAFKLGYGEEHRHNFADNRRAGHIVNPAEGYGHVMFLDIDELVQPVSMGPYLTGTGTDGTPLRSGIDQALGIDATVIWCHQNYGTEDLPNWLTNRIHAQNVFDNEVRDDNFHYEETFYRYLDLGMEVPFSTGTDWFLHDQTMAYARIDGSLSSANWLQALRAGRTFITNGPLLSFTVEGYDIGDTIRLDKPARLMVRGKAIGRNDFLGLELVYNGQLVYAARSVETDGHYEAAIEFPLQAGAPGWIALRLPWTNNRNELGARLRGHTSPIYLEIGGQRRFDRNVAAGMIEEMNDSMTFIKRHGQFASITELNGILEIYSQAIDILQRQISAHSP